MTRVKFIILAVMLQILIGCADSNTQMQSLKEKFPKCKVEPATGLIQQYGYDFIIIDTNMQIIAVKFYPLSNTKIWSLRNIR